MARLKFSKVRGRSSVDGRSVVNIHSLLSLMSYAYTPGPLRYAVGLVRNVAREK